MIRRYKLGRDVELHKRTRRARAAVADRAGRARGRRRGGLPARSTPTRAAGWAARRCGSSRPTSASTSSATPSDTARGRGGARRAGAVPAARTRPRSCASSAGGRATASTSTTRVIPQEAGLNERAVSLHEGLLRRPGDGRAAATTGASRTATCAGCGSPAAATRRRAAARRARGRAAGHRRRLARARPDRAGDRAPRGRARRRRVAVGDGGATRRSSSCRSAAGVESGSTSYRGSGHMAAHVLVVARPPPPRDDLLAALQDALPAGRWIPPADAGAWARALAGTETRRAGSRAALAAWREAGLEAEGVTATPIEPVAVARGLRPGPLRRGDRLDAAGRDVALAAAPTSPTGSRAHRPARHARRGDEQRSGSCRAVGAGEARAAPLSMLTDSLRRARRHRLSRRRGARAPAATRSASTCGASSCIARDCSPRSRGRRAGPPRPRRRGASRRARAAAPRERGGGARARARRVVGQRAPVGDAAARDPEGVERAGLRRVRREHEPRARVRRAQDAAEPAEQRLSSRARRRCSQAARS